MYMSLCVIVCADLSIGCACAAVFLQGPLAWAIIVWRCSLVFSSLDKIVSVLIHLLPGELYNLFVSLGVDKEMLDSYCES